MIWAGHGRRQLNTTGANHSTTAQSKERVAKVEIKPKKQPKRNQQTKNKERSKEAEVDRKVSRGRSNMNEIAVNIKGKELVN